ncbi:MAG TPA: glycosyltransferase [Candidatus Tumulicola sp.]|jgi:glycosyltransferase involved in cell wall biosynthesis
MSGLRVLHIVSTLKAYGAERQVLELIPSLARSGIEARALAVYDSNLSEQDERALGTAVASVGRRGRRDYGFMPKLVRTIASFRPDVVHTHTHVGKYWGRPAARLAGAKAIVHTEHNPCDPRRNPAERLLDRAYGRFTSRFVLFFPEQRDFLARMESIAPEKIVAIPNGLDSAPFDRRSRREEIRRAHSIPDDRLAIMMVGRLEHQKNHELALRAVARLNPALRDRIALYVVGAGARERELRSASQELGIGASTHFLGYRSDAGELLGAADVLLNASHFEGMPITFVEAMLAGVPIVTTPWLGAANMLDEGALGFIAAGWQPQDLARTLERALGDDGARACCTALAGARARSDYTVSRTAGSHVRLYETLAARGVPA